MTPQQTIYIIVLFAHGTIGCSFPGFLWKPPSISSSSSSRKTGSDDEFKGHQVELHRTWLTEQKHVANSREFESRKFIVVKETELLLSDQYAVGCGSAGVGRCVKNESVVRMECLRSEEGGEKIRVKRFVHGYDDIVCFKFVKRTDNIVQLWMSRPCDTDMPNLCSDAELDRQDWPWIAETLIGQLPNCPLIGGFEFRANVSFPSHRRTTCERIWRMSRLESECVRGDGMYFNFPDPECSIFARKETENVLKCVGWWIEDGYTFVVAREETKEVQYALRFHGDRAPRSEVEMSVLMYFSPVCPINEKGTPSGQVMYRLLLLHKSGKCLGEYSASDCDPNSGLDDECFLARRQATIRHGQICRRNCKQCESLPSEESECKFPSSYHGNWLIFSPHGTESLSIYPNGKLENNQLTQLVCKDKSKTSSIYKMASVFRNGCSPRYTCISFRENSSPTERLAIRFSSSGRNEMSLPSCRFDVHSLVQDYSVIVPVNKCKQFSCGLGGLVHLRASYGGWLECEGTMSDWSPFLCTLVSKLAFSFRNCVEKDRQAIIHKEISCDAYTNIDDKHRILFAKEIFQDGHQSEDSCLLIKMGEKSQPNNHKIQHTQKQPPKPQWSKVVFLTKHECSELFEDPKDVQKYLNKSRTTFNILTGTADNACITMTKTVTSEDGAEVTNIRYTVRKNNTVTYQQPRNTYDPLRPQKPLSYSQQKYLYSGSTVVFFSCHTTKEILRLVMKYTIIIFWSKVYNYSYI